jgi:5'-3' exonuclease
MNNYYYIIDTSYIIYAAAASAFKEYVLTFDILKTDLSPDFDPTLDPEFNIIFENKFRNAIERPIVNLVPFMDKSKFIFCIDCQRKNIWRRSFYPEYKIQRDTKDTSKDLYNVGKTFSYAYAKLIPDYCDEFGAHSLKCEIAEGDDLIAISTKYILDLNKFNKIIIVSSDKDMVQLHNKRTHITTSDCILRNPKTELEKAIKEKINEEITADDFLLFKILLGDGSDNIPNIKQGVGNKKAFKLLMDRPMLKQMLTEDISVAKSFKRNKMLISMKEIPEDVENLIISEIKQIFAEDNDNDQESKEFFDINDILDNL